MTYQQYRPSQFRILPPVVKNLLIINGLLYLATVVLGSSLEFDITEKLGLYYFDSTFFKPYQFVTYMFVHGSFMHLFSNMLALWMFGNALENAWGSKRFLIYYMITAIGAALIQLLFTAYNFYSIHQAIAQYLNAATVDGFTNIISTYFPLYIDSKPIQMLINEWLHYPNNSVFISQSTQMLNELIELKKNIPTVGASGGVFAILLAFGMLFPNNIIYLYFAIPIKAKYFVILYGAWELFSGISNNPTDNVAHFAHLGGMLFGFILIKYWQKNTIIF